MNAADYRAAFDRIQPSPRFRETAMFAMRQAAALPRWNTKALSAAAVAACIILVFVATFFQRGDLTAEPPDTGVAAALRLTGVSAVSINNSKGDGSLTLEAAADIQQVTDYLEALTLTPTTRVFSEDPTTELDYQFNFDYADGSRENCFLGTQLFYGMNGELYDIPSEQGEAFGGLFNSLLEVQEAPIGASIALNQSYRTIEEADAVKLADFLDGLALTGEISAPDQQTGIDTFAFDYPDGSVRQYALNASGGNLKKPDGRWYRTKVYGTQLDEQYDALISELTCSVDEQYLNTLVGVSMAAGQAVYPPETEYIQVSITNNSGQDVYYLTDLHNLEVLQDGKWVLVPHKSNIGFYLEGDVVDAGARRESEASLWMYNTPLPAGRYRIIKDVGPGENIRPGTMLSAEFTISDTPAEPSDTDIALTAEQTVYPGGTESFEVTIINTSDLLYEYGMKYRIEAWRDGSWVNLPGHDNWPMSNDAVHPHNQNTFSVSFLGLQEVPGAGRYRVTKDFYLDLSKEPTLTAAFEFELTGDAAIEPAPSTVTMQAEQPTYPVGTQTVRLNLTNGSAGTVNYGMDFTLEKQENGVWRSVPNRVMVPAIAAVLDKGQQVIFTVSLNQQFYDEVLTAGRYRVSKTFFGSSQAVYAEFELVDSDASPKVSMWTEQSAYPLGTPSITLGLANYTGQTITYGLDSYLLEKQENGAWRTVPSRIPRTLLAGTLEPGRLGSMSASLEQQYYDETLTMGHYRFRHGFAVLPADGFPSYAEFDLTESVDGMPVQSTVTQPPYNPAAPVP